MSKLKYITIEYLAQGYIANKWMFALTDRELYLHRDLCAKKNKKATNIQLLPEIFPAICSFI